MPDYLRSLKLYFTGNFHSGDFAYVLYPFLRIFKIFGYVPIKLKNGEILRTKCLQLEWDLRACLWTFFTFVIYVVGFLCGAHTLEMEDNFDKGHDTTAIAYATSWLQIILLFILGMIALITAPLHLKSMQMVCLIISRVDGSFRQLSDIKIDYQNLRWRLFVQFFVAFLVPTTLSMVNCLVMQPNALFMFTTCYWFICFAPIMLLTLKEFQFYNLLSILKSKFDIINKKLSLFANAADSHRIRKVQSISEVPLTAEAAVHHRNGVNVQLQKQEHATIESLEKLLETYAKIGEGVELILQIFSYHLLLITAISFLIITIQSYNLFAILVHSLKLSFYKVGVVIAWITIQTVIILMNVRVCTMTKKAMATTGRILHRIKLHQTNEDSCCLFYQVLQLFSLEVLQRKHNFTAAGFFDMDFKLVTSIIATVTTYLVIIIQYHLTTHAAGGSHNH